MSENYDSLDDGIDAMANLSRELTGVSVASPTADRNWGAAGYGAGLLLAEGCQELFHPKPDEPAGIFYSVTFKKNDGTDETHAVKTVTPPASATASAFPPNPGRDGYIFAGWNTESSGAGSAFTASTAITGNLTVYAQWTAMSFTDTPVWISINAVEGGVYIRLVY